MKSNKIPIRSIILAQISAIVIYSLIAYISWLAAPSNKLAENIIISRLLEIITLCIFSGIVIAFFEWYRINNKPAILFWIMLTPAIYIASLGASFFYPFLSRLVNTPIPKPQLFTAYFRFALYYFVPILFACVAYGLVVYYHLAKAERNRSQKAEILLEQAKWQMLRYQVNPHFLFNALNTIRSMLKKDQDDARKVITELAEYFRFSLSENPEGLIGLEKELAAVKNYLEIQRFRYENKLDYEILFESGLEDIKVPIFGIQTLVENAVKYGMKTSKMPLTIWLKGQKEGKSLSFTVTNTGKIYSFDRKEQEKSEGTHTGLKNLKNRLEVLYRGDANFSLREDNGRVMATILIPLKNNYEKLESNNSR